MSKDLLFDSFVHLRDVLAKCFPKANTFNEGASPRQIDAVEESTGWNIPCDLRRLLEVADGQPENVPSAFGGVSFLSTELMIRCHKRWCELADCRRRPPLEESVIGRVGHCESACRHAILGLPALGAVCPSF